MDVVQVGRVGRPHGLDGSFVVEGASDDPDRFAVGARILAGDEPAIVASSKRAGGRLVIRLDRPVERGTVLAVPRDELPPAGDGGYYVFELVGLEVEEEGGRPLGLVQDVAPGVANDARARLAQVPQPFTLSEARQAWGTSRRVAVPLMEWLDAQGVTVRLPDNTRRLR